jgi:hypothetical protein
VAFFAIGIALSVILIGLYARLPDLRSLSRRS